jgi:hypothetical protein
MHSAVRSSVATGVALVGAGAIALSPIQPVGSPLWKVDVPTISTASVDLAAAYNPFAAWINIFTTTASNVGQIGEDWLSDPAPVVRQLGTNWIGYGQTLATAAGGAANGLYTYLTVNVPNGLRTAFQQLAAGNPADAATTINQVIGSALLVVGLPLFPLLDLPKDIVNNLAAVTTTVFNVATVLPLVVGIISPIEGVISSFGDSAQAAIDALGTGDTAAAIGALFDAVPNAINVFLNGGTLSQASFAGIFTPESGGLVYSLAVGLPRAIATALGAPAATPPAASKQAALSAEPEAADAPAAKAVSGRAQSNRTGDKAGPAQATNSGAHSASSSKAAASRSAAKGTTGQATGKGHGAKKAASAAK